MNFGIEFPIQKANMMNKSSTFIGDEPVLPTIRIVVDNKLLLLLQSLISLIDYEGIIRISVNSIKVV